MEEKGYPGCAILENGTDVAPLNYFVQMMIDNVRITEMAREEDEEEGVFILNVSHCILTWIIFYNSTDGFTGLFQGVEMTKAYT